MTINDNLAEWLVGNDSFLDTYSEIMASSICLELGASFKRDSATVENDFKYLLHCASILSHSANSKHHDYALRIAHFILSSNANLVHKDSAAFILKNLSNEPSILLAQRRSLIDNPEQNLSTIGLIEWANKTLTHQIVLSNGEVIYASNLQNDLWKAANENELISISAPTSAGKSFIIKRWIVDHIKASSAQRSTIVYIVPTRALIAEVERDFKDLLSGMGRMINISSSPLPSSLANTKANILIFTQERLQIFLNHKEAGYGLDILVIDEAHKMGDRYRGVLLQQVLEGVLDKHPKARVIFMSPLTQNPELLLKDYEEKRSTKVIKNSENQVSQNLIWCSKVKGKPSLVHLEACTDKGKISLGHLQLNDRPAPESKRAPLIACEIGKHSAGNIIYADGAAAAEKMAGQLYSFLGAEADVTNKQEIKDLIELVRTDIHKDYYLATSLEKGIAFHYGNMPDIIRAEIERLFSSNIIKFLICTSTLVEGVNTSCKNIYLLDPHKGKGNPMSKDDFWNLAGRAGRWGKEFQGNIFCINPTEWDDGKSPAPAFRSEFQIQRSTDTVLSSIDKLLDYIRSGKAPEEHDRSYEFVFSYLFSQYKRYGSLLNTPWAKRFPQKDLKEIDAELKRIDEEIRLPVSIINRNPGISPVYMFKLFTQFEEWIASGQRQYGDFIPPELGDDGVVDYYAALFLELDAIFMTKELAANRAHSIGNAIVVVDWMRGYPLSRMISSRLNYEEKKAKGMSLAEVIRHVMDRVEKIARFWAPKYLACYADILRHFLELKGQTEFMESLQDYDLLLEYGVSTQTQMSLVSLGLTRPTALALSDFIKSDLSEDECLRWLKADDYNKLPISPVMKRELNELIKFIGEGLHAV